MPPRNDNRNNRGIRTIAPRNTDLARVETRRRDGQPYRTVVATARLPANAFVAAYPGRVYDREAWEDLVHAGRLSTKYGVDLFEVVPGGTVRVGHLVVDPTDATNRVSPAFARALGPFVNEPGPGQQHNLRWVYNLPLGRIEYWTTRDVPAGAELLVCYGDGYEPERRRANYRTACGTDARFWYILEPGGAPRPLAFDVRTNRDSVGSVLLARNAAVRAALQALAFGIDPRTMAATAIQAAFRGTRERRLNPTARRAALLAFHRRGERGAPRKKGVFRLQVYVEKVSMKNRHQEVGKVLNGITTVLTLVLPSKAVLGADLQWLVQHEVARAVGRKLPFSYEFSVGKGGEEGYIRVNPRRTIAQHGRVSMLYATQRIQQRATR